MAAGRICILKAWHELSYLYPPVHKIEAWKNQALSKVTSLVPATNLTGHLPEKGEIGAGGYPTPAPGHEVARVQPAPQCFVAQLHLEVEYGFVSANRGRRNITLKGK